MFYFILVGLSAEISCKVEKYAKLYFAYILSYGRRHLHASLRGYFQQNLGFICLERGVNQLWRF